MSGLAALLAGRKPTGVYHWSSPMRTGDIRHAAEHCGWRCIVLDTIGVADPAEFVDAVAAACDVPVSADRTLAELLRDIHGQKDAPTLIVWEGWASLAKSDDAAAREIVDAFADRAGQQPACAVVLHGPGPDLDLVELDQRPTAPA